MQLPMASGEFSKERARNQLNRSRHVNLAYSPKTYPSILVQPVWSRHSVPLIVWNNDRDRCAD